MGIGKRGSGPPRRPRNPVAKAVRTPLYKPRVEQDKRWKERMNLKTSVERVRRPDQAGVWREATTPQGRSLQGGATKPGACLGRKAGA